MKPKIERYDDGTIKDFKVEDPHHLYVTAVHQATNKILKKEAIAIWSLSELDNLHSMVGEDGLIVGKKWAINKEVIKALKENGDCIQNIPGHPLSFFYLLKPMRYASELKHRG